MADGQGGASASQLNASWRLNVWSSDSPRSTHPTRPVSGCLPHPLLGGKDPTDRIQDDRCDDVLALIDQLRDGVGV